MYIKSLRKTDIHDNFVVLLSKKNFILW